MFVPGTPPQGDLASLRLFVESELQRLALDLEARTFDSVQLVERYSAPGKPREGLVVFADGTSWNPGSGRGVYVFSSAVWVKL